MARGQVVIGLAMSAKNISPQKFGVGRDELWPDAGWLRNGGGGAQWLWGYDSNGRRKMSVG